MHYELQIEETVVVERNKEGLKTVCRERCVIVRTEKKKEKEICYGEIKEVNRPGGEDVTPMLQLWPSSAVI